MPFIGLHDARIHYSLEGPANSPVVVLSHSLGVDLSMWEPQVPVLANSLRVLRYDTRGHGQSSVTPGPYTVEQLGRDVLGLLDALKIERAHFCGLSLGGQIGQWLGANAPQRLQKLILCNTTAKIGTPEIWNSRIETVRKDGMKAVAGPVIERWFTPEFRRSNPVRTAKILHLLENMDSEGYIACSAAVRDFDFRSKLKEISAPVLVIGGTHDPSTPPKDVRSMAGGIPGAKYVELNAAHLSNIEAQERFTAEVSSFLQS